MSAGLIRLSNCQICALIPSMEKTLAGAVQRGDATVARRVQKRLDMYRSELEQRTARGYNPSASEIQGSTIEARS
jgi:hypothetical protein